MKTGKKREVPSLGVVKAIGFVSLLLLSLKSVAQMQFRNWYFGYNAGITFQSGNPVALPNGKLLTNEGCATISDSLGNLLFYTDGDTVYTAKHVAMPNGFNLAGNPSSTQSAIIVKKPGSKTLYYVFTVGATEIGFKNFRYTIVDMSLNGGLGDVTTKDSLIRAGVREKLTAVICSNNFDYWILINDWSENDVFAYKLSCNGFDTAIVRSGVGPIRGGNSKQTVGYMKASPQNNKVAMAINEGVGFMLFDFDNNTGKVSNKKRITNSTLSGKLNYGVEFSPNGNILYGTVANQVTKLANGESAIYQFNLTTGNGSDTAISNSMIELVQHKALPPLDYYYGALQLGPNGKIYSVHYGDTYLGVINNPNVVGIGCNYVDSGVSLGGKKGGIGLPNIVTSYVLPSYDTIVKLCINQSYTLPDGIVVSMPGVYTSHLSTSTTCDSVIVTQVSMDSMCTTHNCTCQDTCNSSFGFTNGIQSAVYLTPYGTGSYNQLYNSNGFTWEAWIKLRGTIINHGLIVSTEDAVLYEDIFWGFGWGNTPNALSFFVNDDGTTNIPVVVESSQNLLQNTWYHVAAVCDYSDTLLSMYLNGNLIATEMIPPNILSHRLSVNRLVQIGNSSNSTVNSLDADIDEIRFWSTVRTQQQIKQNMNVCMPDTAGLVAFFKADEHTGSIAYSSANSNFTGTLSNTLWQKNVDSVSCLKVNDSTIYKIICKGDSVFGHTTTGIFSDSISSPNGCKRLRVLHLFVDTTCIPEPHFTCCSCDSAGSELVTNGDFQAGNIGFTTSYIFSPLASPGLYGINTNASFANPGYWSNCTDHTSGSGNFMWLDLSSNSSINVWTEQINNLRPNTNYLFSCWLNRVDPGPPGTIQFAINDTLVGNSFTAPALCTWEKFCYKWNSGNQTSATITITNQSTFGNGNDIALDDISFRECYKKNLVILNDTICKGDSSFGHTLTGSYIDTFIAPNGCYKVRYLHLLVVSPDTTYPPLVKVCTNQLPYLWYGQSITVSGVYYYSLPNRFGCDSVLVLNFTVIQSTRRDTTAHVCKNQLPFIWCGQSLTTTDSYYCITNASTCPDSIVLDFTVDTSYKIFKDTFVCSNHFPFLWYGQNITRADTFYHNYFTNLGCDSIVGLIVHSNAAYINIPKDTFICDNHFPLRWNGQNIPGQGIYSYNYHTTAGCDSIVYMTFNVSLTYHFQKDTSVCSNQFPFGWRGKNITQPGIYIVTYTSINGCDSVYELRVASSKISSSTTPKTVCKQFLPFTWSGTPYTTSGTYNKTFTGANGCDSIATLVLTISEKPDVTLPPDASFCQGQNTTLTAIIINHVTATYTWDGNSNNNMPTLPVSVARRYFVKVTNTCGSDTASAYVRENICDVTIPNVFSPNNDGVNDRWIIKGLSEHPRCKVDIYNRYGWRIFSSIGYKIPWDGTWNGSPVPVGTYYYIINVDGNGKDIRKGWVAVLR